MNAHALTQVLNGHALFTFLDLAGTFAFALSGAVAARERGLDWFGVHSWVSLSTIEKEAASA